MSELQSRIILKGVIRTLSPLIIGQGKGDSIDLEFIKDDNGNIFIPGTSFIGAIKSHIMENFNEVNENEWGYFWGDSKKLEGYDKIQSHFIINDLLPINEFKILIRDGIAIDETKGVSRKGALFNYEILEPGAKFNLEMEIIIRKGMDKSVFKTILKTIVIELVNQKISLGAMTTKGFGKILLEDYKIYEFNFPNDGKNWFNFLDGKETNKISLENINGLQIKTINNLLEIQANFQIKNSLIIGSNIIESGDSDKVNIKSNGYPILPGTSLKGTIRARAHKIINTFGKDGKNMLKKTFGFATQGKNSEEINENKKPKKDEKFKSRVFFEEIIIKEAEEYTQNRIKIDRFTGSTIEGALFNSTPLWHKDEKINIRIVLKNAEEWEVGLFLLILKDLWTEDLPIGGEKNIGRGVLQGLNANIKFNNEHFEIKKNDGKNLIIEGKKEKLERFVEIFIKKIREDKNE